MASPWEIIETSPEAAAALSWERWIGPAFNAVAAVCLRETTRTMGRIPCASGCACNHRVLQRGTAFVGVCDCGEECEDMPLAASAVMTWKFDLPRLGRAVAKALGCVAMVAPIGFHRTIQVSALGNPALPVMLTVQPDAEHYRNAVAHLLAHFPKGFILLTPTKMCDASALEMLTKASAGFYDLESNLTLLPSGVIHSPKSAEILFAAHLPEKREALKESEGKRIFGLFMKLASDGKIKKAPLEKVFRLTVLDGHSQSKAAKSCDCVPSLISRRVRTIESRFQMSIEQLRNFALVILEMETSVKGQRVTKKKHGAPKDEPEQYQESGGKEDDHGYLAEERQDSD